MMAVKGLVCSVLAVLFLAAAGPGADASEPNPCNPRKAALEFRKHGVEVTVEVRFSGRDSLCAMDTDDFENISPTQISIRFRGKEYRVDEKCMQRMKFDLHGITADLGEDIFVVWFMETHKAVPDLIDREKDAVGVWYVKGQFECDYPDIFIDPRKKKREGAE